MIDVLDDPAQELGNSVQRGQRAKAAFLRGRDALFRMIVRRADVVCTIGSSSSDPLPTLLVEEYGVSADRILPLNQSIDTNAVRSAWDAGVEGRMPRVAFVGFVSPLRGVDTLVEACRILWSAGCRFELILRTCGLFG